MPPKYVPRDIDAAEFGIRPWLRAAVRQGGFLLLVGGSCVGKTRSAIEALRAELPTWWLIHPRNSEELAALATQLRTPLVIWLDEIQNYLYSEHGLASGTLRALLSPPDPAIIVGTIRSDQYTSYIVPGVSGDVTDRGERDVLDLSLR